MDGDGQFKIEKDVPIPSLRRGPKAGTRKYPFAQMEIGDSLLIPGNGDQRQAVSIYNYIGVYRKRGELKAKFTARMVDGGIRVWRIE